MYAAAHSQYSCEYGDGAGLSSSESTWVRNGCRLASTGHAGGDGSFLGNTRTHAHMHTSCDSDHSCFSCLLSSLVVFVASYISIS